MAQLLAAPTRLTIRPARSVADILGGAARRFSSYTQAEGLCRYDSLDASTRLDLDEYDLWAHHLIMVSEGETGEQVVGTLRVVMDEPSPQRALLLQAVAEHPHLLARLRRTRSAVLPHLRYLGNHAMLEAHVREARAKGERIAEYSRLTASGVARRAAARLGVSAAALWVDAAFAYGLSIAGVDRAYLDCACDLIASYASCGFTAVAASHVFPAADLGVSLHALTATPQSLPAARRPRVLGLAHQFEACGECTWEVPART